MTIRAPARRVAALLAAGWLLSIVLAPPGRAAGPTPADVPVPADAGKIDPETKCLALAVYWEGKAEPARGRVAIAHTVLNRARSKGFPGTICGVVGQGASRPAKGKCQFSWWCDGKRDRPREPDQWKEAVAVAKAARRGKSNDPTGGALYFHNGTARPDWMHKKQRLAEIGDHIFYR